MRCLGVMCKDTELHQLHSAGLLGVAAQCKPAGPNGQCSMLCSS